MLDQLEWKKLEERREIARLSLMHKATHQLVAININQYLDPVPRPTKFVHHLGYLIPHSGKDYHLYTFFPWTAHAWNSLPAYVAKAPTSAAFRSRLEEHRQATLASGF